MTKTLMIYNQKGGVAKTSLATEIAANLALNNKRTLLIDFDPQGNVAQTFGINPGDKEGNDSYAALFDFYENGKITKFQDSVSLSVKGNKNLDILYGSGDLSQAEIVFYELTKMEGGPEGMFDKTTKFFEEISKKMGYDYIVIDCSPALNLFQGNLMNAVDQLIIPSVMEKFSQGGILSVIKTMKLMAQAMGKDSEEYINKIKFVVPTKLKNVNDHKIVHEQLRDNLPKVFNFNVLSWEEGIPEATAFARTVREYDTTPSLINHKNKATLAIQNIVEKYLL